MKLSNDYIAGLFDGEGTIGVYKQIKKNRKSPKYVVIVALGMADGRMAKYLYKRFGGSYLTVKFKNPKWKIQYRWRAEGLSATNFLLQFETLLVVKGRQAKTALKMSNLLSFRVGNSPLTKREIEQRDRVVARMKRLNKRGR